MVIHSFRECSILYRSATAFENDDTWVTGPVYETEDLGQIECTYYAMFLSQPDAAARALVREFQNTTRQQEQLRNVTEDERRLYHQLGIKISGLIRSLKEKRVVIIFTCSC